MTKQKMSSDDKWCTGFLCTFLTICLGVIGYALAHPVAPPPFPVMRPGEYIHYDYFGADVQIWGRKDGSQYLMVRG